MTRAPVRVRRGTGTPEYDNSVYALDAVSGEEVWHFEAGEVVRASPTVVTDPASGDSAGSRVQLRTLGHHDETGDNDSNGGDDGNSGGGDGGDSGGDDGRNDHSSNGGDDGRDDGGDSTDGGSDNGGDSSTGSDGSGDDGGNSTDTSGGDSGDDSSGDDDGDGFDFDATLAGLSGAGYLLKRRLDGETDSS